MKALVSGLGSPSSAGQYNVNDWTAAPAHIGVEGGRVSCPLRGRVALDACRRCAFLQGTLDGPDVVILCGFGRGAPLRRTLPGQAGVGDGWP